MKECEYVWGRGKLMKRRRRRKKERKEKKRVLGIHKKVMMEEGDLEGVK